MQRALTVRLAAVTLACLVAAGALAQTGGQGAHGGAVPKAAAPAADAKAKAPDEKAKAPPVKIEANFGQ